MKIMIVDDDLAVRNLIKGIILHASKNPVECVEYESGEEAVKNYKRVKPDYILMDIEMGVMNGLDALKIILSEDRNIKVIMVTSSDTPAHRDQAKQAGAIGFVSKGELSQISKILFGQ